MAEKVRFAPPVVGTPVNAKLKSSITPKTWNTSPVCQVKDAAVVSDVPGAVLSVHVL